MDLRDLQRHWDTFGRTDPFWAILTDPARRGNRWDPAEFFATGRREVAELFEQAARLGVPRHRRRALDFGCGAGRLTQALAAHVPHMVGVDVAPSMIALARTYNAHGQRCEYHVNDRDDLSAWPDRHFDVVYTGRVLQHMEPRYAERYIREFVRTLAPGGYLSFDVPSEAGDFAPSPALPPGARAASAYRASLEILHAPDRLPAGSAATIQLEVTNTGDERWDRAELTVGNRWLAGDGSVFVWDDGRTYLPLPWAPGERLRLGLVVQAPAAAGLYRLRCDVVHEGVAWFQDLGSRPVDTTMIVGDAEAAPPPVEPAQAPPAPVPPADEEPRMEMHAVPRDQVEGILREEGAVLLDVRRVDHCGVNWLAFRYDCTR